MNNDSLLLRISRKIVANRKMVYGVFLLLALFCAFSRNWVQVNDELTSYLPETTETRIALDLMDTQFEEFATAEVMVDNITYSTAEALLTDLETIDGVKSIAFDDTEDHFISAEALFTITFDGGTDDEICMDAIEEVKTLLSPYDFYLNTEIGNPLKRIIDSEMLIVDGIAVLIIILVLFFTSKTFGEIPVLLITFGGAALLNMGTNFLMGEISFVTDSIAIVLQLALAIDYAIILCHRYMEEHETMDAENAAAVALSKAIPEISASSLTTISGLLALCFMQYKLGYDIGTVLIKAILLSLVSVFVLMPGLLVSFSKLIDRTHHKSFVPRISFVGKFAYATRLIVPPIFCAILVAAYMFSGKVNYVYNQYSIESIRKNDMQVAKKNIETTFGQKNVVAVIIPSSEFEHEHQLLAELKDIASVKSVASLSDIEVKEGYMLTDSLNAREFSEFIQVDVEVARLLYAAYAAENEQYGKVVANRDNYSIPLIRIFDYLLDKKDEMDIEISEDKMDELEDLQQELKDGESQLMNSEWTRIVLYLDLPNESEESYKALEVIRGITRKYYDKFYIAGETTSCLDLKESFENDNILISLLTIIFVITVLILTFRSVGLPVLLIMIIQGSIWINFSTPYLKGDNLFFLTYLIISAIQMGANIDYAIVISSRYMELKKSNNLKDAMVTALNQAFPTIITSGTMLASAGIVIGLVASNETISAIGIYLGTGTLISIFLVMFVLPQILLFGDVIIRKTSFELGTAEKAVKKTGTIRIDGHVKGQISGYIDAEIHGTFKGDLNAIIDMTAEGGDK